MVRLRLCQWIATKSQRSRYQYRKNQPETSCWSRLKRIDSFESLYSLCCLLSVLPLALHMSRM
nr:MAG TPA_asm: hypothetical protein [Caudoviricetes sp.]